MGALRQCSAEFSIRAYLDRYSDLKRLFGTNFLAGFKHWNDYGRKENRNPRPMNGGRPLGVDADDYRILKPLFDASFYLNKYADLKKLFGDDKAAAANHWLDYGMREGRQGSPTFSVRAYQDRYSDLKRLFGTNYLAAFKHWNDYGRRENRNPRPN